MAVLGPASHSSHTAVPHLPRRLTFHTSNPTSTCLVQQRRSEKLFCFCFVWGNWSPEGSDGFQGFQLQAWHHRTGCLSLTQPSNLASGRSEGPQEGLGLGWGTQSGSREKPWGKALPALLLGPWVRNTSQGLPPSLGRTEPPERSLGRSGALFLLAHLGHLSWA